MIDVISLGAGVQSSVMALMASKGELPKVDCAIFADTQFEPKRVIGHLDWLEKQLDFPVYRVTAGNIKGDIIKSARQKTRVSNPPFYTANEDGSTGRLTRGCSRDYKAYPVQQKIRKLLGLKSVRSDVPVVRLWIGMSLDEVSRTRDSKLPWIENYYPLIDSKMTRLDCSNWWDKEDYGNGSLGGSSCIGCPHHSDTHWRKMKENDPKSWKQAIKWDEVIREGIYSTTSKLFLHRSLKPLKEVSFNESQLDFFQEECEGMCGV